MKFHSPKNGLYIHIKTITERRFLPLLSQLQRITPNTKRFKKRKKWFQFSIMILFFFVLWLWIMNYYYDISNSNPTTGTTNKTKWQQQKQHQRLDIRSKMIHHSLLESFRHTQNENKNVVDSTSNSIKMITVIQLQHYKRSNDNSDLIVVSVTDKKNATLTTSINNNDKNIDHNWVQKYFYNETRFQNTIQQWRHSRSQSHSVLVIIQQSISHTKQQPQKQQYNILIHTIRETVQRTQQAQMLVYLSQYNTDLVSYIVTTFEKYIESCQLILMLCEKPTLSVYQNSSNRNAYDALQDGLTYAYLLDLAYKSGSNYTLMIPPGWQWSTNGTKPSTDYVDLAVQHYTMIDDTRRMVNDLNRTCWTVLSYNEQQYYNTTNSRSMDVIFFDTSEHASRMSTLLRSTLPYHQKHYTEILNTYCERFIWSASVIVGPALFPTNINATELEQDLLISVGSNVSKNFIDKKYIDIPSWIDPTIPVGPTVAVDTTPPYLITFGVTAMIRPIVNTTYLEMFMNALINIVETQFVILQNNTNDTSTTQRYNAIIVVLVAGDTIYDIKVLRTFLESKYSTQIKQGMIKLIDSPLDTYTTSMSTMRTTYAQESHQRRYWRTKQNLDVGVLFREIIGLSDYLMLLEDDTGFQPAFVNRLLTTLSDDLKMDYATTLPWAQTMYGFGYSGILLHAMDVPVYATLHTTFYDERPCDILDIWRLIRDGKRIYVYSPVLLRYKKRLYLKHLGVQSSLIGKKQIVW